MCGAFFRFVSAVAITASLCLPAAAQGDPANGADPVYYGLRVLLITIALLMAAYYAHTAFEAPITTPDEGPAPPRYMTQARQYRMGMVAYIGLCLIAYVLIVAYYKDLFPFIELAAPPQVRPLMDSAIKQSSMSFPVVVVLGVAALVTLLKVEHEWNPLFALRRVVWGWVSIPELANQIMSAARDDLTAPAEACRSVAADPENHVDIGDFEKDRHSVDRNWAELCYVRQWLMRNRAEGSHHTFFNEPSFAWQSLETSYEKMQAQITPLKQALQQQNVFGREFFEETAARIETLRRQYCRLAAFFIVFKNDTKKAAVRDANQFGARVAGAQKRANPMRYVVLFILAILASIYLGVWVSAVAWDLVHGAASAAFVQDPNVATRWVFYGLANFGAPITVVLLLRYLGWSYDSEQPSSYLTSYASIFIIALCTSAIALSAAVEFGPSPSAGQPFLDLVFREFRWAWAPALICVYVIYHVDRQIDPLLPDVGTLGGEGVGQRLIGCLLFALLTTLISLPPTASLVARPDSPWPSDKLRAVVIGTIFLIGFVMAVVSQFLLIKPTRARTAAEDAVSAPALRPS